MVTTLTMSLTGKHIGNGTDELAISSSTWNEYHNGRTVRPDRDGSLVSPEERVFIGWDGEGVTIDPDKPQQYCLLACHTPDGPRHIKGERLNITQILAFIISIEEEFPDSYHIGFALGYDFNQFLSSLTRLQVLIIHKTGVLYLNHRMYRLEWRKGKSLTISRYYHDGRKTSLIMYDVWTFFNTSFVKACEKFLGEEYPGLDIVREGKKQREHVQLDDLDKKILPYCFVEVRLLVDLMNRFRGLLYVAGFAIRHWHGPGAVASFLLRTHDISDHMCEAPEAVRIASQHAYAAGRFEMPKAGRIEKLYGVDQNSAYPNAIAQLPSLAHGEWRHVEKPTSIARFGLYRIKGKPGIQTVLSRPLAPLFHRDKQGRISYPWLSDGWYWSPEAALVWSNKQFEFLEAWEFWPNTQDRPFSWIPEMFAQRLQWQRENNAAEYCLKIALNSLYGKAAQRVGWDKKNRKPPKWHQLEWAGWVTSYCRATMYTMCQQLGLDTIVAIETDGIYTTRDPREIGVTHSVELGNWKITNYDEGYYVQNGLAWLRHDDEWTTKYRGLDPGSIQLFDIVWQLSITRTQDNWRNNKIIGTSHRFIGAGAALMTKDFQTRFCRWENLDREIIIGGDGKRIHIDKLCRACAINITPDKTLHDLVTALPKPGISAPHSLPWLLDNKDPPWREDANMWKELIPYEW